MKKTLGLILAAVAAVVAVAVYAAQDTTLDGMAEVRDPVRLKVWLEANASDAQTRIAAVEAAGVGGTLAPAYIIVGNASTVATAVAVSGDVTITTAGAVAIGANKVVEAMLKAVDTASDEDFLSYESTTGDFEWHSADELAAKITTGVAASAVGARTEWTVDGKYSVVGGDATTGLMVQKAACTAGTNATETITFAVAFGAAPIVTCTYTEDPGDVRPIFVTSVTASNFVANITADKNYGYIAVGTRP